MPRAVQDCAPPLALVVVLVAVTLPAITLVGDPAPTLARALALVVAPTFVPAAPVAAALLALLTAITGVRAPVVAVAARLAPMLVQVAVPAAALAPRNNMKGAVLCC